MRAPCDPLTFGHKHILRDRSRQAPTLIGPRPFPAAAPGHYSSPIVRLRTNVQAPVTAVHTRNAHEQHRPPRPRRRAAVPRHRRHPGLLLRPDRRRPRARRPAGGAGVHARARHRLLPGRLPHQPDGRRRTGAGRHRGGSARRHRLPRPRHAHRPALGARVPSGAWPTPPSPAVRPAEESPREVARRVHGQAGRARPRRGRRAGAGVLPARAGRQHAPGLAALRRRPRQRVRRGPQGRPAGRPAHHAALPARRLAAA